MLTTFKLFTSFSFFVNDESICGELRVVPETPYQSSQLAAGLTGILVGIGGGILHHAQGIDDVNPLYLAGGTVLSGEMLWYLLRTTKSDERLSIGEFIGLASGYALPFWW